MALATDDAGGSGRASQGAESYLTVRRAPRGEKASLGAVHRRPQQEAGEKCGLCVRPSSALPLGHNVLVLGIHDRSALLNPHAKSDLVAASILDEVISHRILDP